MIAAESARLQGHRNEEANSIQGSPDEEQD